VKGCLSGIKPEAPANGAAVYREEGKDGLPVGSRRGPPSAAGDALPHTR